MTPVRSIGFIGLGRMGHPMAALLARAGFDWAVYDIRPDVVAQFAADQRARAAVDACDLGRDADVVTTMLPTGADVRAVVIGENGRRGIADVLEPGAIIVDSGASDPVQTR